MRRVAAVLALAALLAPPGFASWRPLGSGSGAAKATSVAVAGNVPTGAVSSHSVTLTWTASTYASGATVSVYIVKRYDSVTSAAQTVGSACSGAVSGTTCTEAGVPTGTWKYTVTPAPGNWRGTESPKSSIVIVTI